MKVSISKIAKEMGVAMETLRRWEAAVIINQSAPPASFEEALAKDVLEIITAFSARLQGSRSHQHKQLVEKLRQAAQS